MSKASKKGLCTLTGSLLKPDGKKATVKSTSVEAGGDSTEATVKINGVGTLYVELDGDGSIAGSLDEYELEPVDSVGGTIYTTPAEVIAELYPDYSPVNASRVKWSISKNGTFKSTVSVYGTNGKKYSIKLSGMILNGIGYGIATCARLESESFVIE